MTTAVNRGKPSEGLHPHGNPPSVHPQKDPNPVTALAAQAIGHLSEPHPLPLASRVAHPGGHDEIADSSPIEWLVHDLDEREIERSEADREDITGSDLSWDKPKVWRLPEPKAPPKTAAEIYDELNVHNCAKKIGTYSAYSLIVTSVLLTAILWTSGLTIVSPLGIGIIGCVALALCAAVMSRGGLYMHNKVIKDCDAKFLANILMEIKKIDPDAPDDIDCGCSKKAWLGIEAFAFLLSTKWDPETKSTITLAFYDIIEQLHNLAKTNPELRQELQGIENSYIERHQVALLGAKKREDEAYVQVKQAKTAEARALAYTALIKAQDARKIVEAEKKQAINTTIIQEFFKLNELRSLFTSVN